MKKRLTKSNNNVVISGVLGGIAEYFGVDATVVRVVFLAITLFGVGSPVFLYFLLMLVIPTNKQVNQTNTSQTFYQKGGQYYGNNATKGTQRPRKEAEKVTKDDEWSDF